MIAVLFILNFDKTQYKFPAVVYAEKSCAGVEYKNVVVGCQIVVSPIIPYS